MSLDEETADADGDRRTGKRLDEFALATGGAALPARLLHRMRRVHDHRVAGLHHDGQAAHVGHKGVIAEGRAAAAAIDEYLEGETGLPFPVKPTDRPISVYS